MHLSGAVFVLTFLVPPAWVWDVVDAAYATPPDDPTADAPFLALVVPLVIVTFHVAVQIPAGLLGSWLGRRRTTLAGYGSAVVVAGVLSLLPLWGQGWDTFWIWLDFVARGAIGLGAYLWVVRARPAAVASSLPRGTS
ncbi:hypothetical protein OG875_08370 [Streptomyces sp. NBC_01498]|uniref:hypothetical protein n=1 Tax=Streptomyces sp. NBC_01498 TaxID=2975870 RepID=UPI002E7BA66A|nr:hypothetical protein [Streptomyces sp. NBC_01498]WTL24616.1 hypothetical protein OG875_08370 [Streptomyces sp. NBC_01498]